MKRGRWKIKVGFHNPTYSMKNDYLTSIHFMSIFYDCVV